MFWSLTSAVGFWTAYESIMMWAYANGYAPLMQFSDSPAWFIFLLFIIPWWAGLHFYCQHRLLHSRLLYKHVHAWHHKNSNTGPWSGPAMHPVEHSIWLTDVFLFLFVASAGRGFDSAISFTSCIIATAIAITVPSKPPGTSGSIPTTTVPRGATSG
jgi:sterol desaturase/sphingolipid hydroxylase (fatty acid hydroxylase superfamily)